MATTENNYVGDGSTVLYNFTFPYLKETDVYASVDDVVTSEYSFANATTLECNAAPASDAKIRIYRNTNDEHMVAEFYAGSAIRAKDLNDDFDQLLYLAQETENIAGDSNVSAEEALRKADEALDTANEAKGIAEDAKTIAEGAETTANNANVTANNALNIANNAQETAERAEGKADAALDAVAAVVPYTPIPDVASIPPNPEDGDRIEVRDSTGIENFSSIQGLPAGFVGDPGLTVRMSYSQADNAWLYIQYVPNDPDARYVTDTEFSPVADKANTALQPGDNISELNNDAGYITSASGGVVTSVNTKTGDVVLTASDVGAATDAQGTLADGALQRTGGTMTGGIASEMKAITGAWNMTAGNLFTAGASAIPNPTVVAGAGTSGLIVLSDVPTSWGSRFKFAAGVPPAPTVFPAIVPFLVQDDNNIFIGSATEVA